MCFSFLGPSHTKTKCCNIALITFQLFFQDLPLYQIDICYVICQNEDGKDVWDNRVVDVDMDQPLSNFESYLKVVNVSSRLLFGSGLSQSCLNEINKTNAKIPALPMSVDEETEAAVSAIILNENTVNESAEVTCSQNETKRASCTGPASYNSDDDVSNRLLIIENEVDESTIAERLRQTRRTSAEIQQPVASRNRAAKDYVRGLTDRALFVCGMAGEYQERISNLITKFFHIHSRIISRSRMYDCG